MRKKLTGLVLAAGLVAGCGDSSAPAVDDGPTAAGEDLIEPTVLTSTNGVLDATFTAAPTEVTVDGVSFTTNVFDGSYVPPVLLAQPGDSIHLEIVNEIGPADIEITDAEHMNVHYHGMDVAPLPPGDNVFTDIAPGETYEYEIDIPADHQPGLNWYHPHYHGLTEPQVLSGMSGLLIVDGLLQTHYPDLADLTRRTMMLKDIDLPDAQAGDPKTKTINGQDNPIVRAAPGEYQVWQIGNVGADAFFDLAVDGHTFWVLSRDGAALEQPEEVDSLFLPPGARSTVAIKAEDAGTYAIRSLEVDTGPQGDPNPLVELGQFVVAGDPVDGSAIDTALQAGPTAIDKALLPDDIDALTVTNTREIVFGEDPSGSPFTINGQEFDPTRLDVEVEPGAVEEWTLINETGEKHVFHIHQTEFLVTEIDGEEQDYPGLRDVIDIPFAKPDGTPGQVKVIIPFTDPLMEGGTFVFHCHILEHEDNGMMATIRVGPQSPDDPFGTMEHMDESS